MLGSTVALGDDFLELFVFSAMLGSTVAPGHDVVKMFVFSALLGFMVLSVYVAIPQVQLLDKVFMPWSSCSSQWRCRRCSSSSRSSTSCRGAEFHPHGSDCSADHRDFTVAVSRQGVDMPVVGPHRCFHGVPQVQLLDKVVVPVVCTTNALIQMRSTVEMPQLQFLFMVVNIPVGAQRRLPVISLRDH